VRAALRPRLGDPGGARTGAQAALDLRHAWLAGGTLAEGRYWLDRAGALTGDPRLALASGRLAVAQRAIPQAVSLLEPARDAFVTARDPGGYARSLCALGAAALATDDHADALRLLDDGVARTETTLDTDACLARIDLAEVLLALGDADRADALCRDVVAACEQRGEQWVRGSALLGAARSALVRGDLPAMRACATDALRAQRAVGAVPGASVSLTMLALLAAADGQFERAAVLHGAAYRARSASGLVGVGPSPADPDGEELRGAVRIVREELGDRPYQEAFRHGAALRTDQAAAYALREPDAEQAPETGSAA
jgi:non-specific serine/threonine protein kinase